MSAGFRVAALQMRSGTDRARNVAALREGVREAAGAGARLVQSPEMTGLVERDRTAWRAALRRDGEDPVMAAASGLAREHGLFLHLGSTPILREDGRAANRSALFGPDGSRLATYDKIHMFDVDLPGGESWRESAAYAPGEAAVLAPAGPFTLGLTICYDLRFPALSRALAQAGATLLAVPSCFTRQTGAAHWHVLLRARAIETGAFVLAAAQGGRHEDGRETFGHSMLVDPWGAVVAELDHDEPGVLVADCDPARVAEARARIPSLAHDRPFAPPAHEAAA